LQGRKLRRGSGWSSIANSSPPHGPQQAKGCEFRRTLTRQMEACPYLRFEATGDPRTASRSTSRRRLACQPVQHALERLAHQRHRLRRQPGPIGRLVQRHAGSAPRKTRQQSGDSSVCPPASSKNMRSPPGPTCRPPSTRAAPAAGRCLVRWPAPPAQLRPARSDAVAGMARRCPRPLPAAQADQQGGLWLPALLKFPAAHGLAGSWAPRAAACGRSAPGARGNRG
jgi:hypothetical protein